MTIPKGMMVLPSRIILNVFSSSPSFSCAFYQCDCPWAVLLRQGGLQFPRASGAVCNRTGVHLGRVGALLLPFLGGNGILAVNFYIWARYAPKEITHRV